MTKKGFIKKGLLLMLTFSLTFVSVPVMAAEEAPVSVTTLAAAKNGWVKEKAGYCYYKNGKKVTNKLIKVNGKTYYVGANGVRKTGWYTVGNKSYYFASNGVCQKSKKIDAALVKAMDSIIKKGKITEATADKTALKKLFTYCTKNFKYQRVMGFKPTSGWQYTYAKQMLTQKKGSCYHDAAVYACLIKRATGLPVRVCIGEGKVYSNQFQAHGWVEVKVGKTWYTYDTNANRFSDLRKGKWFGQKRSAMEGKVYKTQKVFNVEL